MFRKTLTAALAIAAISGSALLSTASASQAGYHGGYGYGHGYGYGYRGGYHCFTRKVKVHGYYGWHWKRIKVCG